VSREGVFLALVTNTGGTPSDREDEVTQSSETSPYPPPKLQNTTALNPQTFTPEGL